MKKYIYVLVAFIACLMFNSCGVYSQTEFRGDGFTRFVNGEWKTKGEQATFNKDLSNYIQEYKKATIIDDGLFLLSYSQKSTIECLKFYVKPTMSMSRLEMRYYKKDVIPTFIKNQADGEILLDSLLAINKKYETANNITIQIKEQAARFEKEKQEQRAYQLRLEKAKKDLEKAAMERRLVEKADSLRKIFVKSNLQRLKSFCEEGLKKSEQHQKQLNQIEKSRFAELDALERQYVGRLNGEIFLTKKNALNKKWEEKANAVGKEAEKELQKLSKLKCDVVREFNDFLVANGVKNVRYGDFYNDYYNVLVEGNLERAFDNLFETPNLKTNGLDKYEHTNYRIL